jgi:hypothetical protein
MDGIRQAPSRQPNGLVRRRIFTGMVSCERTVAQQADTPAVMGPEVRRQAGDGERGTEKAC